MRSRPWNKAAACFLLCLSLTPNPARAESIRILVQSSPLAGSQYHALSEVASRIRLGDRLSLIREPDNRHDPWAVQVEWQGHKLGYIPRKENRAVAAALDRGEKLSARVSRFRQETDPWQRLELEVYVDL